MGVFQTRLSGARWRRRAFLSGIALAACGTGFAHAQARPTAVVARVIVDPALTPPPGFPNILRRELELALDQTGLFTIPTRDPAELNAVLDEIELTRGRGAPVRGVQTIVAPTITSIELTERRRRAPYQETRDLITVAGSISLQITVMNARDATVLSRFPLEATYRDEGRLVDRNAPAGTTTANANAYVLLAREAGRALGDYLRARNPAAETVSAPMLVVERIGDRVYLSPPGGVAVGDELRVFAAGGREIRHPQTGELLGTAEEEIGRVRIVELQPRMAVASVVSSTGEIASGATVHR